MRMRAICQGQEANKLAFDSLIQKNSQDASYFLNKNRRLFNFIDLSQQAEAIKKPESRRLKSITNNKFVSY